MRKHTLTATLVLTLALTLTAPTATARPTREPLRTPENPIVRKVKDVVKRVFGMRTPSSSTKPMTGHALGAAGAIEAAICWLALARNPQRRLPPHWWDGVADPALPAIDLVAPGRRADAPLRHALSQSFAFGGSNAALVFGVA